VNRRAAARRRRCPWRSVTFPVARSKARRRRSMARSARSPARSGSSRGDRDWNCCAPPRRTRRTTSSASRSAAPDDRRREQAGMDSSPRALRRVLEPADRGAGRSGPATRRCAPRSSASLGLPLPAAPLPIITASSSSSPTWTRSRSARGSRSARRRVACYYGVPPPAAPDVVKFDDPEPADLMDAIAAALRRRAGRLGIHDGMLRRRVRDVEHGFGRAPDRAYPQKTRTEEGADGDRDGVPLCHANSTCGSASVRSGSACRSSTSRSSWGLALGVPPPGDLGLNKHMTRSSRC